MIFYEIKINYTRQTGEDNPAPVNENYLIEGYSCTDVETRLLDEIKPLISGEWEIKSCKQVQYLDIFASPNADYWYKARVENITIDDRGKEKRQAVNMLVQANNITEANKLLHANIGNTECEVIGLTKSKILEIYRAVK